MADKTTILFRDVHGDPIPLLLKDNGDGTYSLDVDATIQVGSVDIGKVDQGVAGAQAWPVSLPGVTQAAPLPVSQTRVVDAAGDVHAPAVNTAAVVTYAADASHKHIITGVAWSYIGGIPVGGNLKIEDGSGNIVFQVDIADYGCGSFEFPRPKIGSAVNTAMIVTLAAGGAGVTGKVSVLNHWTE